MKKLFFLFVILNLFAAALEIKNLRVLPNEINAGDTTRIMFALDAPARVSISIKNLNGNSITSIIENVDLPNGQFAFAWNSPKNLTGGFYVPYILATDKSSGETFAKQLDFNTAKMVSIPFKTSNLPQGGKKISYSLDKPALVSIRVGINNGPMYKIISNWELTQPGSYSVDWDGWDNSHVLRVDNLANHLIDVRCIPVEINALRVRNNIKKSIFSKTTAPELLKDIHAFIPEFSAKTLIDKSKKSVAFNINVNDDTLNKLEDIPFEYVLYIDGERYGEIENAVSPYTWEISTKNLSNGSHIFTLMVCTSIEQINTRSFKLTL